MARYKLTSDPNFVLDTETGATIPVSGTWQSDEYVAWLAAGNTADPLPAPTFADYVAQFTPALQAWMESVAQSNAYDSVLSCVSYKDSSVHQFAGDAAAMIAWRDALWTWAAAYQANADGQLPNPMPTVEELIAMAPQPVTYGWVIHQQGTIIESQLPPTATS